MTLHQRLHRSRLVSLLQQWGQGAGAGGVAGSMSGLASGAPGRKQAAAPDVAARTAQWLGVFDADRLNAALHTIESFGAQDSPLGTVTKAASAGGNLAAQAVVSRVQQVKAELVALVQAANAADDADFAPHATAYLAVQKTLANRLGALREQLRRQVAALSPDLRRLAALDSVMEQMLGAREQKLWASLPAYLEPRLAHWQAEQVQGRTLAWRPAFERDMRALLMAELDVRLQPVVGLAEAAQH